MDDTGAVVWNGDTGAVVGKSDAGAGWSGRATPARLLGSTAVSWWSGGPVVEQKNEQG
jgi:hypothetical protein